MCDQDSTLKRCSRCKIEKVTSDFQKNKSKKDSLGTECKACVKVYLKDWYIRNAGRQKEKGRSHYQANKQSYVDRAQEWAKQNPEKDRARRQRYAEENRDALRKKQRERHAANPEINRQKGRDWRKRNPDKSLEQVRKRQACKLRAMPVWADREEIKAIYAESRRISEATGIKHHVDHFYPLRGELVCGLHVPANLQIIPAHVNQSKGAKMPETLKEQTECPISPSSPSTTGNAFGAATQSPTAGQSRPSSACSIAA